ncbi:MAG: amino acid racemase [Acidobacteriota bacterium]|jgi:aspartate racemase
MRTIGVLGGLGPQATMDFEARLHAEARRVLEPRMNQGYPPLITLYLRHPPVLLDDEGRARQPLTLDPRVLDAAARLGSWADLLAIPSNTPHLFLDEIAAAAGCEIVSIVDVTIEELQRRGCARAGLVGLGIPDVYRQRLGPEGIDLVTAPEAARARLDEAILRLMEGREEEADRDAARAAVAAARDGGTEAVILGCTEIPLLLGEEADRPELVNPAALLARETVRRAVD